MFLQILYIWNIWGAFMKKRWKYIQNPDLYKLNRIYFLYIRNLEVNIVDITRGSIQNKAVMS